MERTTRRLTEAEAAAYKDKTPLAVGYKIFNWDGTEEMKVRWRKENKNGV